MLCEFPVRSPHGVIYFKNLTTQPHPLLYLNTSLYLRNAPPKYIPKVWRAHGTLFRPHGYFLGRLYKLRRLVDGGVGGTIFLTSVSASLVTDLAHEDYLIMHPGWQRVVLGVTFEVGAIHQDIEEDVGGLIVEAVTALTGDPPSITYVENRLIEMMGLDHEHLVTYSPVICGTTIEFVPSAP